MNDPLEHNVYRSVNISHPSYLVSFAFEFHYYFTKLNEFSYRMLCISNLALAGLYLAQFNDLNNLFNFHPNS